MARLLYFPVYAIFLPIYLAIVYAGYAVGIPKFWPEMPTAIVGILAVLATAFVWLMAVLIGQLHKAKETGFGNIFGRSVLYVAVFLMSGLGIANALFYYFEVPGVLTDTVQVAQSRIERFAGVATQELTPTQYLSLESAVHARVALLQQEVMNSSVVNGVRYCGVGEFGREHIRQIQTYLPTFTVINGSESGTIDCDDDSRLASVAKQYADQADRLLVESDTYRTERVAQRNELLGQIRDFATQMLGGMATVRAQIDNLSALPNQESPEVRRIVVTLTDAESRYRGLVLRLQEVAPTQQALDLPTDLALENLRNMGSFLATVEVVMDRAVSGSGSWYNLLYFILPLAIDLIFILMILALANYAKRPPSRAKRTATTKDVEYILAPAPRR